MNSAPSEASGKDSKTISLSETDMMLWRETLAHLRHLSEDVWNGMKLFLVWDGFMLLSLILLFSIGRRESLIGWLIGLLSVSGVLLTLIGRYVLKRHRVYYLQMLAKKSLLEEELGFYRAKFKGSDIDLAFPWRLAPEVVAEIRGDFDAWVQKSIRAPGTIARFQFLIYEALVGLFLIMLLAFLIRAFH